MSSVFFLGDLHLGHKAIAKYRPEFRDEQDHFEYRSLAWHTRVRKHDKVFVLGDCAFTKERLLEFSKWTGTKALIMGNHCYPAKGVSLLDLNDVFEGRVYSLYKHKEFWLSHAPLHPEELRGRKNIHGHTHFHVIDDPAYINVCPEVTLAGEPVSIDEIRNFIGTGSHVRFKYEWTKGY